MYVNFLWRDIAMERKLGQKNCITALSLVTLLSTCTHRYELCTERYDKIIYGRTESNSKIVALSGVKILYCYCLKVLESYFSIYC